MKKISILFLFLNCAFGSFAQQTIDSQKLMLDLKILSADDMQGRSTGTEGGQKAREYILQRLKENEVNPFVPGYLQSFRLNGDITGNNILAVIPGKKKETIVISAHYDHLGIRNNKIHNGADDNASGVATLLALIKYFKEKTPEHRLVFAFFDAEEKRLKGSEYFVNTIDLQKENIVLNINLDMVSRSDKNELYACGGYYHPQVKNILEKINAPESFKLLQGHDDPATGRNNWTPQSDQYNFYRKKIPFVYFGVEDHADYHKSTDDFDKIIPAFFYNSAETILQCTRALDTQLK